jgi:hypothetical protein
MQVGSSFILKKIKHMQVRSSFVHLTAYITMVKIKFKIDTI